MLVGNRWVFRYAISPTKLTRRGRDELRDADGDLHLATDLQRVGRRKFNVLAADAPVATPPLPPMSRGAQPDYDDEARKLWSSLGLDALGQGVPARHSYNALDAIYRDAATGGVVYVGNQTAASSRKVLAAEWIDGEQLARSPPGVIRRLVPVGVECFLAQLLDVGFFHGDPHPGNLLVDGDGRLVLIDFGLCAEIDKFDSRALTATMVHLMRGDVPALIDDAVTLRFLPPDVDRAALLPPLSKIFEQGKLAVASEIAAKRNGAAVAQRRAQFGAVSRELNQIFFDFPFAVPEYFALITRALIVLEGIALSGDKDFDLFNAAYPYAQKHARELFGAKQLASMLGEAVTSDVGALLRPAAEPAAPPRRGSRMVSRVTGRLMVPSPPVT